MWIIINQHENVTPAPAVNITVPERNPHTVIPIGRARLVLYPLRVLFRRIRPAMSVIVPHQCEIK